MFGFQETASYNFHQVPIEDFQQAKVSDFLVLSVSFIIDKDLKNFMSLIFTALWTLFTALFEFFIMENNVRYWYCIIHYPSGSWCSIGQLCRQWIRGLDLWGCCGKQVCIPNMYILISLPHHIYLKPLDIVSYCLFFWI